MLLIITPEWRCLPSSIPPCALYHYPSYPLPPPPHLSPPLPSPPTSLPQLLLQMFSIQFPYFTMAEVLADRVEQLSLVRDQPVRVLDSKRSDWWLVSTIPEDEEEEGGQRAREGWVQTSMLQPDNGDGSGKVFLLDTCFLPTPSQHHP